MKDKIQRTTKNLNDPSSNGRNDDLKERNLSIHSAESLERIHTFALKPQNHDNKDTGN